jgi:hypothetical protein
MAQCSITHDQCTVLVYARVPIATVAEQECGSFKLAKVFSTGAYKCAVVSPLLLGAEFDSTGMQQKPWNDTI